MFWSLFWIAPNWGRHPRGGREDRGGKDWYFNFQRLEGLGRALGVGCGYGRKVGSVLFTQVEDTEDSHSISQVPLGWALASQLCSPSYVGCPGRRIPCSLPAWATERVQGQCGPLCEMRLQNEKSREGWRAGTRVGSSLGPEHL